MKKALLRFAALITVLCLLLTGCSLPGIYGGTHFKDMIYTRPSLPELNASAERCIELAQSDASLEDLWEQIAVFFSLLPTRALRVSLCATSTPLVPTHRH